MSIPVSLVDSEYVELLDEGLLRVIPTTPKNPIAIAMYSNLSTLSLLINRAKILVQNGLVWRMTSSSIRGINKTAN